MTDPLLGLQRLLLLLDLLELLKVIIATLLLVSLTLVIRSLATCLRVRIIALCLLNCLSIRLGWSFLSIRLLLFLLIRLTFTVCLF